MVFAVLMTVLGAVLLLGGVAGCIIPAIPGPVLAYLSLILVSIPGAWELIPVWLLVMLGVVAVATTVLDSFLPALSSKKAGAGKAGVTGSIVGMIAGSFLSPIGTIVGAFVGAFVAEVLFHRENTQPLRAAIGVFRGTVLGILIKLAATGIIGWYFVRASIRLFA
jgi:uncharacterized protein